MIYNIYIKCGECVRMEQVNATSINDAVDLVSKYIEDYEEIVFAEENLHPKKHNF